MNRIIYILAVSAIIAGCNLFASGYEINGDDMLNYKQMKWEDNGKVLVFTENKDVETIPLQLDKGTYSVKFRAHGTAAYGVTPHFVIRFGDSVIKDMNIDVGLKDYQFNFELPERAYGALRFIFDNEHHDDSTVRNMSLHFPIIIEPH